VIVKTQVEVVGAKCFQGNVEGVAYDSTTLYVKMELDDSRDTARGFATVDYKFGTSEEFDKLRDQHFPFLADVEIELTTTGKADKKRLVSMVPAGRRSATAAPPMGAPAVSGGVAK